MPVDVLTEIVIDRPLERVAAYALMASAMRRANQKDLARIKQLLEQASTLGE